MRRRMYNCQYYHGKNTSTKKSGPHQANKEDEKVIYEKLQAELKKKKGNLKAIKEYLALTLKERRGEINGVEYNDPSRTILQKYPFLKEDMAISSNKLKI